jgi:hypothetical protein
LQAWRKTTSPSLHHEGRALRPVLLCGRSVATSRSDRWSLPLTERGRNRPIVSGDTSPVFALASGRNARTTAELMGHMHITSDLLSCPNSLLKVRRTLQAKPPWGADQVRPDLRSRIRHPAGQTGLNCCPPQRRSRCGTERPGIAAIG